MYTRSKWFLQGVPSTLWIELFYRHSLDQVLDDRIDFDDFFEEDSDTYIGKETNG